MIQMRVGKYMAFPVDDLLHRILFLLLVILFYVVNEAVYGEESNEVWSAALSH